MHIVWANNAKTQRRTLTAFIKGEPKQQRAIKLLQQLQNKDEGDGDVDAVADADADADAEELTVFKCEGETDTEYESSSGGSSSSDDVDFDCDNKDCFCCCIGTLTFVADCIAGNKRVETDTNVAFLSFKSR
uniref:Uncharacterized protein n=1 Tax=Glossina palpalis gambiensis TaxID=67801 RepID=A0A1B0AVQ3_9MUSC